MWRRSHNCYRSRCSERTSPTSLGSASSLGNMPAALVCRLRTWPTRSGELVHQILLRGGGGDRVGGHASLCVRQGLGGFQLVRLKVRYTIAQ